MPTPSLVVGPDRDHTLNAGRHSIRRRPYPCETYELIASLGTLDTVNDLARRADPFAARIGTGRDRYGQVSRRWQCLASCGLSCSNADGDRPAARIHPMVDTRAAAELMQRAGFKRQVVDSRSLEVTYPSSRTVVGDLRAFGLTNRLTSIPPPIYSQRVNRARDAFDRHADDEGRLRERFEILTLTGWAH